VIVFNVESAFEFENEKFVIVNQIYVN